MASKRHIIVKGRHYLGKGYGDLEFVAPNVISFKDRRDSLAVQDTLANWREALRSIEHDHKSIVHLRNGKAYRLGHVMVSRERSLLPWRWKIHFEDSFSSTFCFTMRYTDFIEAFTKAAAPINKRNE